MVYLFISYSDSYIKSLHTTLEEVNCKARPQVVYLLNHAGLLYLSCKYKINQCFTAKIFYKLHWLRMRNPCIAADESPSKSLEMLTLAYDEDQYDNADDTYTAIGFAQLCCKWLSSKPLEELGRCSPTH